jgi:hypothetical protein
MMLGVIGLLGRYTAVLFVMPVWALFFWLLEARALI